MRVGSLIKKLKNKKPGSFFLICILLGVPTYYLIGFMGAGISWLRYLVVGEKLSKDFFYWMCLVPSHVGASFPALYGCWVFSKINFGSIRPNKSLDTWIGLFSYLLLFAGLLFDWMFYNYIYAFWIWI